MNICPAFINALKTASLACWLAFTLSIYVCLPLALLIAPIEVSAGYCDNDNDAPDADDAAHPQCQPPLPEKNRGGDTSCPDSNAGQCKIGQFSGNPINNSSGNKFEEEVDYVSSGVYPLSLIRYYNSQSDITNGPFGANWNHAYSSKINKLSNTLVKVIRADEKTFTFSLVNNAWQPSYLKTVYPINYPNDPPTKVWVVDESINSKLASTTNGGWQYTTGNDEVETYNSTGHLTRIANRAGLEQILSYDAQGRLQSITDPFGLALTFAYDAQNRISSITNPDGNVYVYSYDANNNLASVTNTDAGNRKRKYLYENAAWPHALTGLVDEKNVRFATWGYDASGWAISSSHVGGVDAVSLTYDKTNLFTDVTNALGDKRRYTFRNHFGAMRTAHEAPVPTCATPPCYVIDPINSMTYDDEGNLTQFQDINNNTTRYVYDTTRNLQTSRTEPGRTINTEWHPVFRLPKKITEANPARTTEFSYDDRGNITRLQVTDPAVTTTNNVRFWVIDYTYMASVPGAILKKVVHNPPGEFVESVTTIDYYPANAACIGNHNGCRGQIKQITNPLGHTTSFTSYNVHGQPTQIIDANNVTTNLSYNARLQLKSLSRGGETTQWLYVSPIGLLTSIRRPDGSELSYTYDDAHRLTMITDSTSNTIKYKLDLMGNPLQEDVYEMVDPGLPPQRVQTHQYSYFANGRLKTDTGAVGQTTTYTYDYLGWGNLRSIENPKHFTTQYGYDGLNRLTTVTDPLNHITRQAFDSHDNLTSITDRNNHTTTYRYDGLDNLKSETSPDRGTTTYTQYDQAGNLLKMTDARGYRKEYGYDPLNRLGHIYYFATVPATDYTSQVFYYDQGINGKGRLTRLYSDNTQTDYSYDKQGRVLNMTQTTFTGYGNDGTRQFITQTLSHLYEAGTGQMLSQTYPSGLELVYRYDPKGNIAGISLNGQPLLDPINYRPFAEAKNWTLGNGTTLTRGFDDDGRLQSYPLGVANRRSLTYDPAGRISQYKLNGQLTNTLLYDEADRLTNGFLKTYGYDNNGYGENSNRTSVTIGATTYPYVGTTTNNRLQTVAGPVAKNYQYDASGRVLFDGKIRFNWAYEDHPATISDEAGNQLNVYEYNSLEQRVVKKGTGLTNGPYYFVYDSEGHLVGEYDKNNSPRQETIYLGDTPVAVVKPNPATGLSVTYYIHADHLDTPRVITNTANTPVWRWDNSDAFGVGLPNQDPDGDGKQFEYNLRFPGQYYDKETGLHYNGHRYYDPQIGRYISYDPIGLRGEVNPYAYVDNNPINFVDPLGLDETIGFGQSIKNLPDGSPLPNGGEGVVSMSGPGSPVGISQCTAEAASNLAPLGKLGVGVVGAVGKSVIGSITKAVNSNLPHAIERAVQRNIFPNKDVAAESLRNLTKQIDKNGFPANAIQDTAHADRVLVPIGNGGLAVYQVGANGTAKLKTTLIKNE